jgi:hypothetical protein
MTGTLLILIFIEFIGTFLFFSFGWDWLTILCFQLSVLFSIVLLFFGLKENRYWLPGIWTAFGIGGTFLSLLINIKSVDASTFKDPDKMVNFIKDFASAFSTSLVGIAGSLVIKLYIKIVENQELKKLQKSHDPELQTEQYFLNEIDKKIALLVDKQQTKEGLNKWQTDLIEAIHNQKNGIETKLSELQSRYDFTNELLYSIGNSTQEVQKTFEQTAEELVNKLHESLSPILGDIGKAAFDKIEIMLANMDIQLSDKMGKILENLHANLTDSIDKLVSTLENQTKDTNLKILKGIESLVETLRTQTEETNVQNKESLKVVSKFLELLKTKTEAQESKLDDINQKQQENYSKMLGFYEEWQKNIEVTNNQIAYDHTKHLDNIGEQWGMKVTDLQNKYVDTFQNIAKDMGEKFINIKEILDVLTQSQKEYKTFAEVTTNKFDESVKKFSEHMRETANQADKINEFTEKINGLTLDVDKVIKEYNELTNFQKEHREHTISISNLLNGMTNLKELIDHLNKYK